MTHQENEIFIAARPQTIFRFANDTERWPEYLPHYRYVSLLRTNGEKRVVEMAAWRGFIPVTWVAEQWSNAGEPWIRFRHIRSWTRGMEVMWRFTPLENGTLVSIEHDLDFRFPVARDWIGEYVVGEFFFSHIASLTLERMKALAEAAEHG